MDNIYLIILIILMALAVVDLIVGVSNDAVNFLNSAIGSKVAPRHIILIVASLGIMTGVMTSSGMMEIARSGVFFPEMFSFPDIMTLFLAVMLTDVILLDLFNTFGLPTSTTVSLIFELLGAAVCVALFNISRSATQNLSDLSHYINSGRALGIISGIFISVAIAFVCGTVVMYVTRLIFSFRYKSRMKFAGSLWCGFALTAITYFALFKGLKDTPIFPEEIMLWMKNNPLSLMGILFAGWSALMFVLNMMKINILRITVLAGTFSLALAFAGNDLVNFIGVFMAGFDSYNAANAAGSTDIMMGALNQPVVANIKILFVAGIIMVMTLWFSKKAQTVSDTEINLARQDMGVERFGSTSMSRAVVRSCVNFSKKYDRYMPERLQRFIETRFRPAPPEDDAKNRPPFDLIRATVNLTVASLLIAFATSLKLPLSTTYVTFMVAMGSSLADRAWGRESAVYRVTGVLTVIAGWFMTAFIAFSAAFLVAMVLMWGGKVAIFVMVGLCAFLLFQSSKLHRKKTKKGKAESEEVSSAEAIVNKCIEEVSDTMIKVTNIYNQTLNGLATEDRKLLKNMVSESEELFRAAHERKHEMMPTLLKLQENYVETGHYYVQVVDYLNEVAKALVHITRPSFDHINNNHEGLTKEQLADLQTINNKVSAIYYKINTMLEQSTFDELDNILGMRDDLLDLLAEAIKNQIRRVKAKPTTTRSSILFLTIINETKTMVLQTRNLLKSQKYFVLKQ